MNLQKCVMEIISKEWIDSKDLAGIIAQKYPEEFKKKPYQGNISALSMALGPSLHALRNKGLIKDDGTEWPANKRWRRVESKELISVDDAAQALITVQYAKDKDQAIRMLAARTIREHKEEFEELIKEISRINEDNRRIGKKLLGIK